MSGGMKWQHDGDFERCWSGFRTKSVLVDTHHSVERAPALLRFGGWTTRSSFGLPLILYKRTVEIGLTQVSYVLTLCDLLFADKLHMETNSRVKSRPISVRRIWKKKIIDGPIHAQTHQKDIGHAHELAPQCAWTYSLAECWDGSVWSPHWKTQMGYPCSRSLSFKAYDHGLALQAAFRHLFNLGLLSPSFLGSSIESSRFASLCLSLPLF